MNSDAETFADFKPNDLDITSSASVKNLLARLGVYHSAPNADGLVSGMFGECEIAKAVPTPAGSPSDFKSPLHAAFAFAQDIIQQVSVVRRGAECRASELSHRSETVRKGRGVPECPPEASRQPQDEASSV